MYHILCTSVVSFFLFLSGTEKRKLIDNKNFEAHQMSTGSDNFESLNIWSFLSFFFLCPISCSQSLPLSRALCFEWLVACFSCSIPTKIQGRCQLHISLCWRKTEFTICNVQLLVGVNYVNLSTSYVAAIQLWKLFSIYKISQRKENVRTVWNI